MGLFDFFTKKKKKCCPYCGVNIEIEYSKKFKCPNCNEMIYINKDDKLSYIDQNEFEQLKIQKNKQSEINSFYKSFNRYYLTNPQLEKRRNDWIEKFGEGSNLVDLKWSIYNEMLLHYGKLKDYHSLNQIYFEMVMILNDQKKDFFPLLKQSKIMELMEIKQSESSLPIKVEILACKDSCDLCKELDRKTYSVDEALKLMPIPHKDCNHRFGFCRCMYTAKIESTYDDIINS